MIALLLTLLIAAYLLGPDLVSRFILGFVCPRKNIVQSKGEELTRAIAWASFPLAIAVLWAYLYGPLQRSVRWTDWTMIFSGAYSETFFEKNRDAIFKSAKAVFWCNFAVLWRMYLLVVFFWCGVDLIIYQFGSIRSFLKQRGRFAKVAQRAISLLIIPRISEWHIYLSNMLTEERDIRVHADVLTKGNVLYQGFVADKFLTSDGELSAIILAQPRRFRREEYMKVKLGDPSEKPDKDNYWAVIPSNTFLVLASEIVSINLLHSSPTALAKDEQIVNAIRSLLEQVKAGADQELR